MCATCVIFWEMEWKEPEKKWAFEAAPVHTVPIEKLFHNYLKGDITKTSFTPSFSRITAFSSSSPVTSRKEYYLNLTPFKSFVTFIFVRTNSDYFEPRSHESFVMNSGKKKHTRQPLQTNRQVKLALWMGAAWIERNSEKSTKLNLPEYFFTIKTIILYDNHTVQLGTWNMTKLLGTSYSQIAPEQNRDNCLIIFGVLSITVDTKVPPVNRRDAPYVKASATDIHRQKG